MTHQLKYNRLRNRWEYPQSGLGDAAQAAAVANTGASVIAKNSSSILNLLSTKGILTASAAANAAPVVGQIASAVILISGLVLKSQAKAKAIKSQRSEVEAQNAELRTLNYELDSQLTQANNSKASINAQLKANGLAGLFDKVGDALKNVFTPAKVEAGKLNNAIAENTQLNTNIENKISILKNIQSELETLYNQLTGGTTKQKILIWGGLGLAGTALIYLGYQYFKEK